MRTIAICIASAGLVAACGLKGPLYLPDEALSEEDRQREQQEQRDGDDAKAEQP